MAKFPGVIPYFMDQKVAREKAEAKKGEETRKIFQTLMNKAVESGNQDQLIELSKGYRDVGGDPSPFLNAVGQRTPEQKLNDTFNQMLAERMGLVEPKQPSPFARTDIAVDQGTTAQPKQTPTTARETLETLFTPEFAARLTAKKFGTIDVGEHAFPEQVEWYKSYNEIAKENPSLTKGEIFEANLIKFGWAPESSYHIKNLSPERREQIAESLFGQLLHGPKVVEAFSKSFPDLDRKSLVGMVLNYMRSSDSIGYTPKRLQMFLDKFDNLHDDMVAFRAAEEAIKAQSIAKGRLAGEFEMEAIKPVSAEDRAKYGIGSKIPTYEALANQGFRFPSESDRKSYQEFSAARETILSLKPMIDSIFKGIGDDLVSRKASQMSMVTDIARGTDRGKQIELYKDSLAAIARQLVRAAGESGGRYTDKDVMQVMKAAPDLGGFIGPPDSEDLANMKFERWITSLNKMLAPVVEGVVMKPTGGNKPPTSPQPKDQFTKGKRYRDAQGNEAEYLGDGKWQKISSRSK